MNIQRTEEFLITPLRQQAIQRLLTACFPGYPKGRTYHKQIPNFRYLAFDNDQLIGHLAVEHRIVSIDQRPFAIFGVVDICVSAQFRNQQIAAALLEQLEILGRKNNIDFIMLTTSEQQLYLQNGYRLRSNSCRWLFISDHRTLGVKHHHLSEAIMVKALGDKEWSEGTVDFLGPIF